MLNLKKQTLIFIMILISVLFKTSNSYALPFTIVPKGPLPTEVLIGGSAIAFYTVTNNTNTTLVGNFVKYLPPNVTQVTSDNAVSDLCGANFTLAPFGKPTDSCTLELKITGPVDSSGCDKTLHLFVCAAKAFTCAGTAYPLNVKGTTIIQPLMAVGNYSLGPISLNLNKRADGAQPALIANTNSPTSWIYITLSDSPGLITTSDLFSVSCAANTCVTVGRYNIGNGFQPALIVSNNRGLAWHYVLPNNFPGSITTANLNDVTCINTHCTAVGYYDLGSGTQMALITSSNNGATWEFVTPNNSPGTTVNANLNTVRCTSIQCITVGQYNLGGGFQPAVIISNDMGVTWQFINPIIDVPPLTSIALSTVDCAGTTCAAAGQLNDGSETLPAIVASNNGGPWHFITPINPPGTIRSARLRSVRCVNHTCVAVGQYTIVIGGPDQPALIVSTDDANTWQFTTPDNAPGTINSAILVSADCTQSLCAAVGNYNIGAGNNPAIVVTSDAGQTWHFEVPTNSPGVITDSLLNSVFCHGNVCIAVGNYNIGSGTKPAIIRTVDAGASWQFIFPSNPPGEIRSANLFSIDCKNNLCTAVGLYDIGTGTQPLIIVSADSGNSWQFVTPKNPPGKIISGILHRVANLIS